VRIVSVAFPLPAVVGRPAKGKLDNASVGNFYTGMPSNRQILPVEPEEYV
jgi:hypothetical protein